MPEIRETKETRNSELSRLVEQSLNRLHDMERRIQVVQSEIFNLTGSSPLQGPIVGNPSAIGSPLASSMATPNGPSTSSALAFMPWNAATPFGPLAFATPSPSPSIGPISYAPSGPRSPYAGPTPAPFPGSFASPSLSREGHSTREIRNLPAQPRIPEVNFIDSGEKYLIHVEIPGVKKDNLDLTVTDRTITVEAEVKPELPDGTVIVAEALPVMYRRTIALPTSVNANKCKAALKDGFLTLELPKREPTERPHRVDVAYG